MLYDTYEKALTSKLERLTDDEIIFLEAKGRENNEHDLADTCSKILLQRRNRPIMAKDEYRVGRIAVTDEDFDN